MSFIFSIVFKDNSLSKIGIDELLNFIFCNEFIILFNEGNILNADAANIATVESNCSSMYEPLDSMYSTKTKTPTEQTSINNLGDEVKTSCFLKILAFKRLCFEN